MRTLGIDFGTKRIGIALSDPLGILSSGIEVIQKGKNYSDDIIKLKEIIGRYTGIEEIVIGLPKTLKNEESFAAQKVREFASEVEKAINLKVILLDERLTTAAVEKSMIGAGLSREKRKGSIDKAAAAMILQNYLDSKRR